MAWVYTYTDCAGNTDDWTYTYTIEVEDFLANMPDDDGSQIACDETVVQPTPPPVNDNCGNPITPTGPELGGTSLDCGGTITFTWNYADCEGNNHDWVYTYTVVDSEYPTASNPEDIVLGCNATFPAPDPLVVTDEDDNCSIPEVTFVGDDPPLMIGCLELIVRTYQVADACDNAIFVTQNLIRTLDALEPEFECPEDLSVTCIDNVPPAATTYDEFIAAGGSVSDNCGVDVLSFALISNVTNGNQITRTYYIEDMCDNPAVCQQTITIADIDLETYVYLEGSMINPGGVETYTPVMRTSLNALKVLPGQSYYNFLTGLVSSPVGQPYSGAPWNYGGTEGAAYSSGGDAGYNSGVTDWVLVSLRIAPDAPPLCQKACLLHNDGTVEFTNGGFDCCELSHDTAYFVVIEHRDHLIVMSPDSIPVVNGTMTFDFRFTQSYINDPFGFGGVGQKELLPDLPGVFAMYTANGNQTNNSSSDVDINSDDQTYWGNQNSTIGRYRNGDYNLNGDCNYNDRTTFEFNNGLFTTVPRY